LKSKATNEPVLEDEWRGEHWDFASRYGRLKPKSPMVLEHIGIREVCCSLCGQISDACRCYFEHDMKEELGHDGEDEDECLLYYSPAWFGNGKNRLLCSGPDDKDVKSWIIFADTIHLLH